MSKIIGFANKFYTLWNYRTEKQYVCDSYGKYWVTGEKEIFEYIKNISFDLNKVKSLYPGVEINDELRGKTTSWSRLSKQDYPAGYFWWGKYTGKTYEDVIENDFKYMLWAIENNEGIKDWALTNPIYIKYLDEQDEKYNEQIKAANFPQVGETISIEFTSNGRSGNLNYFIYGRYNNIQMDVICDSVKEVNGLYPYLMPFINGKFQKTKNKTLAVKIIEILDEKIYTNGSIHQTIKI